jgi:hypothetical protein
MRNLDRRRENVNVAHNIVEDSNGVSISLDVTSINELSSNKRIGIRRIVAKIDPMAFEPFRLDVNDKVRQHDMIYIYAIRANINLTTQKMSDLGQIIIDQIKSSE